MAKFKRDSERPQDLADVAPARPLCKLKLVPALLRCNNSLQRGATEGAKPTALARLALRSGPSHEMAVLALLDPLRVGLEMIPFAVKPLRSVE